MCVKGNVVLARSLVLIGTGFALIILQPACTVEQAAGTRGSSVSRTERRPAPVTRAAARDTSSSPRTRYSVDDEMSRKIASKPVELTERVERAKPDTFAVQEGSVPEPAKKLYEIVYRVQVYASKDRAAAENTRQRAAADTRMAAYLEFEEGLYKVRVGDFAERKEAAEAKTKFGARYPGSWVVMTTVRK